MDCIHHWWFFKISQNLCCWARKFERSIKTESEVQELKPRYFITDKDVEFKGLGFESTQNWDVNLGNLNEIP